MYSRYLNAAPVVNNYFNYIEPLRICDTAVQHLLKTLPRPSDTSGTGATGLAGATSVPGRYQEIFLLVI